MNELAAARRPVKAKRMWWRMVLVYYRGGPSVGWGVTK